MANGRESIPLNILIDDEDPGLPALQITESVFDAWVLQLQSLEESAEKQHLMLLTLEHARAGQLAGPARPSHDAVVEFADTLGLERMLDWQSHPAAVDAYVEQAAELAMRAAMERLNKRLLESPDGAVLPWIVDVMSTEGLTGNARTWFTHLAVQLCCDSGEFEQLKAHVRVSSLISLSDSDQIQQLCLSLPALVSEGLLVQASDVMHRLSRGATNGGWLNTGCIRYAMRRAAELERAGEIGSFASDPMRREFLALLDAFKADWFSRLHDTALIDTLVELIADSNRFPDNLRSAVFESAMRHFSLSPAFWLRLEVACGSACPIELARARECWQVISTAFEAFPDVLRSLVQGDHAEAEHWLISILGPLEGLSLEANPEGFFVLREALCNLLHHLGPESHALQSAAMLLTSRQTTEAVRLEAFPTHGFPSGLSAQRFAGLLRQMPELLRQCSDTPTADTLHLQKHLAVRLAQPRIDSAEEAVPGEAAALALRLAGSPAGCLGLDAMAYLVATATPASREIRFLCQKVAETVGAAIAATREESLLPASLLSGLARLRCTDDEAVRAVTSQAQREIRVRFGDKHADAMRTPSAPLIRCGSRGFWSDTLLVRVYGSDKENPGAAAGLEGVTSTLNVLPGDEENFVDGTLRVNYDPENIIGKLRVYRWILDNSDAQFVIWISDGTALDVDRLRTLLAYRKHHYYGHAVRVALSELERHQVRPDGSTAFDRSPPVSLFADASFAVSLSRLAIARLLHTSESLDGQRLRKCAGRTDKLIGDLLALEGIAPSSEDFEVFEQRTLFEGALPVALGANTFLPLGAASTVASNSACSDHANRYTTFVSGLHPRKIWPTCSRVSIGRDKNQLELLTPTARSRQLQGDDRPVVVAVLRNEMLLLPQFLAHYRKLGVGCFVVADNCSDDGTREYLYEQEDVVLYSADTQYRLSHYGVTWQQAILGNHCLGRWVVVADADEFLVFEDFETRTLAEQFACFDAENADAALIHMIDMYPYGDLASAKFSDEDVFQAAAYFDRSPQIELMFGGGHFSNSRNFVNALRHRIAPSRINAYVSQKYAVFRYKPWMRFSEGLHYAANIRLARNPLCFAHFKYHAGFKQKVMTEVHRQQHFNGAEEYMRYANMLAEGTGAFGQEAFSARWQDSGSFAAFLSGGTTSSSPISNLTRSPRQTPL